MKSNEARLNRHYTGNIFSKLLKHELGKLLKKKDMTNPIFVHLAFDMASNIFCFSSTHDYYWKTD